MLVTCNRNLTVLGVELHTYWTVYCNCRILQAPGFELCGRLFDFRVPIVAKISQTDRWLGRKIDS